MLIDELGLTAQLDAWPDSALVCDAGGTILFVNRAWRRFAAVNGYRGPDFVGQNYFAVCGESEGVETKDSDAVARGLRRVAAGEIASFSYRYPCHAPHQKRWFKLVATAHQGPDGERLIALMHLNVTDEMVMVPDSEIAARSAMLAHDVRTGLNGVLGYLQLARVHLAQSRDAGALIADLHRAEEAGWRINSYLEEIMLQARAAPGVDEASEEPLDLAVVLEAALGALGPQVGSVQVETEDALEGARLFAPSSVLYRILKNLLSNAIKYNRVGGWVRAVLRLNRAGGIEIEIADGGVGMDAAMQARAFERFARDASQSSRVQGSGLGLATVKDLAEAFDADVSVESELGRGSTFTVRFPSWRTEKLPPHFAAQTSGALSSGALSYAP
ncbi:MAG: PAS domain-containing sensor histidine kinase [Nitratireductor sp.]